MKDFLITEKELLRTTVREMLKKGVSPKEIFNPTGKYTHLIELSPEECLKEIDKILEGLAKIKKGEN